MPTFAFHLQASWRNIQRLVLLVLGCLAQTCDANSWSRCDSKICFISAKDSPLSASEGLNTQAHSEQPQPWNRSCSIHTSLRRAATYRRKTKSWPTMFRFICFLSPYYPESFSAFKWPSRRIGATCCFDRAEQTRPPESLGAGVYL